MEAWTLPLEIFMEEILPRLPARSLRRLKCVCKFFRTLISSPNFIDHHLSHSLSSDAANQLHILIGEYGGLYAFHFSSPEFPAVSFRFPGYINEIDGPYNNNSESVYSSRGAWGNLDVTVLPLRRLVPKYGLYVSLFGSCNGLVCIRMSDSSIIIFNPSTGIYRKIDDDVCTKEYPTRVYGFGFDDINHDYKIVTFWISDEHMFGGMRMTAGNGYGGGLRREVRVYSLNSDSWSVVEETSSQDSMVLRGGGALICNHLVHWAFYNKLNGQHRIGCFDLRNNQWGDDVPLPDYDPESAPIVADVLLQTHMSKKYDLVHLGVLDGCLCLLTEHNERAGVDVWVMNEYGVKDSWVKLVRISTTGFHEWLKIPPFVYGKGSRSKNLMGVDLQSEVSSYNIRDKIRMWSEKHGVPPFFRACMCKGSLVSIPGGVQFEIQALT